MGIIKRIFWENKWTSSLLLFLIISFPTIVSEILYWDLIDIEKLVMRMALPLVLAIFYLVLRMVGEGFRHKREIISSTQREKPVGPIRQLLLSLGISILVSLLLVRVSHIFLYVLSGMFLSGQIYYEIYTRYEVIFKGLSIVFFVLVLGFVFKWLNHLVRSVKLSTDEKSRKYETKMVFTYLILAWVFFFLGLAFAPGFWAHFYTFLTLLFQPLGWFLW